MIDIIAHDTVQSTIVLLVRIVMMMVGCVVTIMTTGCWNLLLLRCVMRHWGLLLLLLLPAIAGTVAVVQRALAIRYETIWCRWWQLLLATGRRSTIGSNGWRRLLRDLSSDVRLIWLDFACTAMTQQCMTTISFVCALMKIIFYLEQKTNKKNWKSFEFAVTLCKYLSAVCFFFTRRRANENIINKQIVRKLCHKDISL